MLVRRRLRTRIQPPRCVPLYMPRAREQFALKRMPRTRRQHLYSADAKAKWRQKVFAMERKHSQILSMFKGVDAQELLSRSAGNEQVRSIVARFQAEAKNSHDKGPWDVAPLNKLDTQLENIVLRNSGQRTRALPSRETVDKQNDRTRQAGSRALEKLGRLGDARPFVLLDLAWTSDLHRLPGTSAAAPTGAGVPPELGPLAQHPAREGDGSLGKKRALELPVGPAVGKRQAAERARGAAGARGASGPADMEVDGGSPERAGAGTGAGARARGVWRSSGAGGCVPSVRESHVEATVMPQGLRARNGSKGFVDAESASATMDSEHLAALLPPGARVRLPLALGPALEQLARAAAAWRAPGFLAPERAAGGNGSKSGGGEAEEGAEEVLVIRQAAATRSAGGARCAHAVTVRIGGAALESGLSGFPWDARAVSLRSLPVAVSVAPDCLLDLPRLLAAATLAPLAAERGAPPGEARAAPRDRANGSKGPGDKRSGAKGGGPEGAGDEGGAQAQAQAVAVAPGAWLGRVLDGVAAHLGALDALQAELETLCAGEWGALLSVRLQRSAAPAPVGVEAVFEWSLGALGPPGGAPGGTRAPALALATDSRYPLTQVNAPPPPPPPLVLSGHAASLTPY